MQKLEFCDAAHPRRHLALFLPGLGDTPEDVVEAGFIEEMRAAPQFDSIIADAHFGYYRSGVVTTRLHEDIVRRVRGKYDEFWIVGTSMGGYGAVAYAEKFTSAVTGIVLLAPYLGQDKVQNNVEEAGSLAQWKPEEFKTESDRTAHAVALWAWLQQRPTRTLPFVFVGSGDQDKHMPAVRLLRPSLPSGHTLIIPGDHDWTTWRQLFHRVVHTTFKQR